MLLFLPLLIPKAAFHFGTFSAEHTIDIIRNRVQRAHDKRVVPTGPIFDALEGIKLLQHDVTAFGVAATCTAPPFTTHIFLCTKQDNVIRVEKCYWGDKASNIYAIEMLLTWCDATFPDETFTAGDRLSALERFAFE